MECVSDISIEKPYQQICLTILNPNVASFYTEKCGMEHKIYQILTKKLPKNITLNRDLPAYLDLAVNNKYRFSKIPELTENI